jgi:BMFP domain-containing protein YqiC
MKSLAITLILFLAVVPAYGGATIGDYKERIRGAVVIVDQLIANESTDRAAADQIRRSLPQSEIVEENGDRIETANAWLHADLESYLSEPDEVVRTGILLATRERLTAIIGTIDELEAAKTSTTKDADREKLGEILSRHEFQKPQVQEESLFQKWMRQIQEWFERSFPRPAVSPEASPAMGSIRLWLQVVVFALVIGLVVFLLYKFVPVFSGRRKRSSSPDSDRVILGERIANDHSASDLFSEAERLAQNGELRAAIRKGYIALLVELADRKVIGLARHKTNRDYLRDVRKRLEIVDGVSGLTSNFERSWYGLRPATEADWNDFRDRYRETIRKV